MISYSIVDSQKKRLREERSGSLRWQLGGIFKSLINSHMAYVANRAPLDRDIWYSSSKCPFTGPFGWQYGHY
jgi:membrane-anchored protein YejM (alkaline phosphatase superfamily)